MSYLTYDEYEKLGGTLADAAFNRNIDRACGVIDAETHGRIAVMKKVPAQVKALCRDLVEYFSAYTVTERSVTSKSQSAGGVSESESYGVKTKEEQAQDVENLIVDYLLNVTDDAGTPLLYRGCSV